MNIYKQENKKNILYKIELLWLLFVLNFASQQ